jgi:hypothetical protein
VLLVPSLRDLLAQIPQAFHTTFAGMNRYNLKGLHQQAKAYLQPVVRALTSEVKRSDLFSSSADGFFLVFACFVQMRNTIRCGFSSSTCVIFLIGVQMSSLVWSN